jgi:hypothetical protein
MLKIVALTGDHPVAAKADILPPEPGGVRAKTEQESEKMSGPASEPALSSEL